MKLFICFLLTSIFLDSIYNFSVVDHTGNTINLNQFSGKKILFVNTASGGQYAEQYSSLETLYQKYKDSLVIIATPSNSFGHETGNIQQIINQYNIHFIVTDTQSVIGNNQAPIYEWLTQVIKNGIM